jgi:hypothetical protein
MSFDTIKWLAILGLLGGVEVVALLDSRRGDTLSETVWRWFRVHDRVPNPLAYVARGLLLVFLVWLTGHLVFGWWTP